MSKFLPGSFDTETVGTFLFADVRKNGGRANIFIKKYIKKKK